MFTIIGLILVAVVLLACVICVLYSRRGWLEITEEEYKHLLTVVQSAKNHTSTGPCHLFEKGTISEEEWDGGILARDTLTWQDGQEFDFSQKPRPETTRCFCKVARCRSGWRIMLRKSGLTQPCGGELVFSHITSREIEIVGGPAKVRFSHSGIVSELPGMLPQVFVNTSHG